MLGVELGAFACLGRVVDQVRADDRRFHALQHHLPKCLAHDNLQVHRLPVVLRFAGGGRGFGLKIEHDDSSPAVHRQAVCGIVGYAGKQAT